jgi:hypothetical protein
MGRAVSPSKIALRLCALALALWILSPAGFP